MQSLWSLIDPSSSGMELAHEEKPLDELPLVSQGVQVSQKFYHFWGNSNFNSICLRTRVLTPKPLKPFSKPFSFLNFTIGTWVPPPDFTNSVHHRWISWPLYTIARFQGLRTPQLDFTGSLHPWLRIHRMVTSVTTTLLIPNSSFDWRFKHSNQTPFYRLK